MKSELENLLEREDFPKDMKEIIKAILLEIEAKKKIEEELVTSEAKFRRLFQDSPTPLIEVNFSDVKKFSDRLESTSDYDICDYIEVNPNELNRLAVLAKFVNVNRSALELYEANSLKEFNLPEFTQVRSDQQSVFTKLMFSLLSGKKQFEEETVAYTLKGKKKDVLLRVLVVPGFEKTLSKVFVSVTDISKLKKAEKALIESETRFRRLFEDSPVSMREIDLSEGKKLVMKLRREGIQDIRKYIEENPSLIATSAKLLNVNAATLDLFEAKSKEDLLQGKLSLFGDQLANFREDFMDLLKGETMIEREREMFTLTGKKIQTIMKIFVVPGFEDSLSKIFVSIIDITKFKEAESAIRESEKKARSIIDHSRDGVILIDEEGIIVEWNSAIARLTGISSAQAFGVSFWRIYNTIMPDYLRTSESLNLILEGLKNVLSTGEADWVTRPIDTEILLKDGTQKYVQINIFPIRTQTGFMVGSIWRDVTKSKTLENKMKQELLKFKIEDQVIYLVKEVDPILSREVLVDLLRIGYSGLIMSRTPEIEYRENFDESYEYIWLAETGVDESFESLFQKMESSLKALTPKSVTLIERLDFLIAKYGFEETLKFIYKVREIAIFLNLVIILSLDEQTVTSHQLALLEKETEKVETRVLAEIPLHLLEIIRFIYINNSQGVQPSYTQVANQLGISRPTARKRIKQLTTIGYLRENQKGRTKILELTLRGLSSFTSSSD
jgi:PAS domain S-box-containing protein